MFPMVGLEVGREITLGLPVLIGPRAWVPPPDGQMEARIHQQEAINNSSGRNPMVIVCEAWQQGVGRQQVPQLGWIA